VGISGRYLSVPEVRLRVWVVVRRVRPAVALGDTEVEIELRRRLGDHRRAAVGVHGELLVDDALVATARRDELWRGGRRLALGDLPADDHA